MFSNQPLCFCINAVDNVATLLADAEPGECKILGDGANDTIILQDPIPCGHKVSLSEIDTGAPIIKYGIAIGHASQPIIPGQHIHLHNCQSAYDERSSSLNHNDGSPTDIPYE